MDSDQHTGSEYPIEVRQDTGIWVLTWTGILASFVAILFFTYHGYIQDAWQLHIVALSMVGLLLTAIISTILIRRKKPRGIWFFLVGGQISIFVYSLLIDGRGLISLACILTLSSLVAIQSLSTQGFRRAFNLALIFGILAGLTDFVYLPFQFVLPNEFRLFGPGVLAIVTLVYVLNLTRNFRSYNPRVQIVFTFTSVCLAALGIFSLVMIIFIQRRIDYDYNYALVSTAEHTAKVLDDFFAENLNSINAESQIPVFSQYLQIPKQQRTESTLKQDVHRTLISLAQKDPEYIISYSLLDFKGIIVVDTDEQKIGEDRSELDYFRTALETGQSYVSPVEFLKGTNKASFYFSAPVFDNVGGVLGVLLVQYQADLIQDLLVTQTGIDSEDLYAFIVDEHHVRLAHSLNPDLRFKSVSPLDETLWKRLTDERRLPNLPIEDLSTNLPSMEKALQVAKGYPSYTTGIDRFDEIGNKVSTEQAAFYSTKTQPWQVVCVVDRAAILAPLQELAPVAIMLTTVLLGIISMVGLSISKVLSKPFRELAEMFNLIAAGNLDVHAPVLTGTDAGTLAQAFNTMMAQIRLKLEGLENTIAKRNQASQHHANQMNTLAEVSSAIAATRVVDELLPKIAQLISQQFGYYHVGIFLLDSTGEYAVLQAANSKGGERMMARNLQVRVDEKGIVGYVFGNKEPRIVGNVLQDGLFLINPDLPDTRSEMAMPLLAGDRVIGVLDVQSTEPHAFAQDDVITLRLLADQVAIAIDNARLFRENQDALRSIQRAYSDLSQEAWSKLLHEQPKLGYLANRMDFIYTPANGWHPEMIQASQTGSTIQVSDDTLAIPIKERNHILGILRLRKPDSHKWSKEELALAETLAQQLYLALENARLYQETQRRAERERLASEITAKMRASNDPQVILQTAIQELRRALNIPCDQVMPQPAPREVDPMPPQQGAPSQESE